MAKNINNNVFYIMWLDPLHNMYPNDRFGGLRKIQPPSTCCRVEEQKWEELENQITQLKKENETYQELFEQKENTKFVIKFKNFKEKYIFVPTYFQNQKEVDAFAHEISRFFGPVDAISTDENIGKRELLKARYNQFIKAQAEKKRIRNAGR